MKTTTQNLVNIELRDEQNDLISVVKKHVTIQKAFSYVRRHNWTIWHNGTPCNLFIAWN